MDRATRERRTFRRMMISLFAASALVVGIVSSSAGAKVPGPNGRIVFLRFDPALGGDSTNFEARSANSAGSRGGTSSSKSALQATSRIVWQCWRRNWLRSGWT